MSASRSTLLPFLYPILFKPQSNASRFRVSNCRATKAPSPRQRHRVATFSALTTRAQEHRPRYGTANEPPPHLAEKEKEKENVAQPEKTAQKEKSPVIEPVEEEEEEEAAPKTPISKPASNTASTNPMEQPKEVPPKAPSTPESQPLETVLHMPSPAEAAKKPPHLQAPPYVHHFDTYSLVKRLEESGFTQAQSITAMKGVRALLTNNMGLAQDGLVSKSNVENETYLFRAACSELRTEIQNNRKAEMEKMRQERTQLQHEVDILNQRFGQENQALKDELKGLFDDRKMAVRGEQKKMENTIQELNYKITVALNSDARSEVEGLRWVLTRRAATALAISAVMILATLRYSTYMTQTQEKERKEMEKRLNETDLSNGGNGGNGGNGSPATHREERTATRSSEEIGGAQLIVSEGGDKGYVSLG